MSTRAFLWTLVITFFLAACHADAQESGETVASEEELDALLAGTYESIDPDTLDLLPGRFREAYLDLPEITEYGVIRVLVSASRTNYFMSAGFEHGFEYELMREYEKVLERQTKGRFVMVFLPLPFELLLPALVHGRGDIVASGLTITPERQEMVAFSDPYLTDVEEVVVGRKGGIPVDTLTDLSGREVTVVRGSSFERHLVELNEQLEAANLEPAVVNRAPPYVEAEDLLELVNNGLVEYTIADNHVAELWSAALADLEIYRNAPLKEGGRIAWAVRKESTELRESLSSFAQQHRQGSLLGNILFNRYFDDTDWISGARSDAPPEFDAMRSWVQEYADEYDFDWLLLAAVAHQESRLDQGTKSSAGAVGLFQIKPEVASKEVGVENVHSLQQNILAGVRYLDHVRDTYLDEPDLTDVQKNDLMLASYNAGPNRIRSARRKAAENGYDGNTWFGNVERFAPRETRTYVANIDRLYYAFKLGWVLRDTRQEEIKAMEQ